MRILLVGVGGLGGEYLHALLNSHIPVDHLCIVDPDTISTHTTSRHPLFTRAHLHLHKATVAASLSTKRIPSVSSHPTTIQHFNISFYKQFEVVVCAVDCVETRRHVNAACRQAGVGRVVEGGVEGWMGHARGIDWIGPCLECHADLYYHGDHFKPVCQPVETRDDVVLTAPFVNALIAGLMLSLTTVPLSSQNQYLLYNAKTCHLGAIPLGVNPDCVVCQLGDC